MKVSLEWLNEFVDINVSVKDLAEKLVSAGFEVEEIIDQLANMKNVVLGRIESLSKVEKADKLQCCQINIGKSDFVQIVTGANNIAVGDLVPVALDNSLLPTGQVIKKGKLMGVESYGMLCSGEELCLTESMYKGAGVYGILIMNDEKYPVGTDINVVLGNTDIILDIGVTANRPDCNSVLGIAREVATVLKQPLKMPDISFKTTDKSISDSIKVNVIDKDLCPRYMAAEVSNIKIMPSTAIMQKRLKAVGLRPINNIVDVTNYILMEIGQPMHAFDKSLIRGGEIIVRRADNDEEVTALDEKPRKLDSSMLTIRDKEGAVAIAGVMGGLNSAISDDTKDIIFESAKFMRDNIRRTSRILNLRSDSSTRYERGIDFLSQELGLKRALSIISENGWGDISTGIIDELAEDLTPKSISVEIEKINEILGITVPTEDMVDILNSLQITTKVEGHKLICTCPAFRDDIENANDLAEEVIRLYGYSHITCTLMDKGKQTMGRKTIQQKDFDKLANIAVNCGYNETLTYSFVSPKSFDLLRLRDDNPLRKCVKLLNPLGEDMSVMRTNLASSMLEVLASNALKSNRAVRFFETARVYIPKENSVQPDEYNHMVLGCYGDKENFFTIKSVIEHIAKAFNIQFKYERSDIEYLHSGRSADIMADCKKIGYVGEVNPMVANALDVKTRLYIAEINIDDISKLANTAYSFEPISKYPPVERDLAIVVEEAVSAAEIIEVVEKAGGKTLKEVEIFDIYRSSAIGENMKSVALKIVFRLNDRTLTDEEVQSKMDKILKKLESGLNAKLR